MRRILFIFGMVCVLATPARLHAWGYDAHKFIVARAISILPDEVRPLFEANRAMVVEHSIDPDLWRESFASIEDPHHYLDFDWDGYGPYPFAGLPRNLEAAIKKFGKATVDRNGTLPWRTEEMYGKLKDAFAAYPRRGSFARFDILFYSAWLGHYVSDAHVPLHAVTDSDGQKSGQRGIHTRFEALMFERYVKQLKLAPKRIQPVRNPLDFTFDTLLQGTQLVPTILEADRSAIGSRDVYDNAYYDAFFKGSRGRDDHRGVGSRRETASARARTGL
jgi:Zinc dependent phospholipase C